MAEFELEIKVEKLALDSVVWGYVAIPLPVFGCRCWFLVRSYVGRLSPALVGVIPAGIRRT